MARHWTCTWSQPRIVDAAFQFMDISGTMALHPRVGVRSIITTSNDTLFGTVVFGRAVVEDYWALDSTTGWGSASVEKASDAAHLTEDGAFALALTAALGRGLPDTACQSAEGQTLEPDFARPRQLRKEETLAAEDC